MKVDELRLDQEVKIPEGFDLTGRWPVSPPRVTSIAVEEIAGTTLATAEVSWSVKEIKFFAEGVAVVGLGQHSEDFDARALEPA